MADKRDYYDVLGISKDADAAAIKKSYRKLALKFHPDRNPDDKTAESNFKEAAEAYEVLSDDQKRQVYDQYGHAGLAGRGNSFNSFEDIFSAFGDVFGDSMFDSLFGGGRSRGGRAGGRRGASLRCELDLSLDDVLNGVERTIELRRQEICEECEGSGAAEGSSPTTCSTCRGHGEVQHSQGFITMRTACSRCRGTGSMIETPCRPCRGTGRKAQKAQVRVNIPAGIEDGTQLRVPNQGEAGEQGGPRGDLFCFIHVEEHEYLRRHGRDLVIEMPLSFTQAALGTILTVPTLESKGDVTIPPGTQSGDIFRLKGMGMPTLQGSARGNQLVQVFVETPRKLSGQQKELLREFAKTEDVNVEPRRKSFFDKVREYFEQ